MLEMIYPSTYRMDCWWQWWK